MIVSVVGKADKFDVIFAQDTEGRWCAAVPADLSDGTYIVEVWATDSGGNVAYYTAVLYMYEGVVTSFEISPDKFALIIATRYTVVPAGARTTLQLSSPRYMELMTWRAG